MTDDQLKRFLSKTTALSGGCWNWSGQKDKAGYSRMLIGSRTDHSRRLALAHRLSYEHWMGSIDKDKEIDHLCRNRGCVNPTHLEQVPHIVNVQRGLAGQCMSESGRRIVTQGAREYWLGRKHRPETKDKIASTKIGKPRPWTPEWKAKIVASRAVVAEKLRGRTFSEESRAKMRAAWARRKREAVA